MTLVYTRTFNVKRKKKDNKICDPSLKIIFTAIILSLLVHFCLVTSFCRYGKTKHYCTELFPANLNHKDI